jgi:hypothetical protein
LDFTTAGPRTLTATYNGSDNDLSSESAGFAVTVNP